MKRSVSVVIPNYNGKEIIGDCINAAKTALEHAGCDHEIIVSDDASKDDSVDFIHSSFPYIKLLTSNLNSGFSININKGIRVAKHDLVLLLNSDVILSQNYFDSLFQYFDDQQMFGVMGRISWKDGRIQDAAKYPKVKGVQVVSTKNIIPAGPGFFPTLFLSGANALVDRNRLMELGGMEELFSPYYFEDVDLSLRAWRLGWKCAYEHEAICFHATSATIGKNKKSKVKIIAKRNKFLLHWMHLQGVQRIGWCLEILFNSLFRWIALDKKYYSSLFQFLKMLKEANRSKEKFKTLQKKHNSKRSITVVIDEIKKGMEGKMKGDIF
jgi:GT2 family glycosyltransferase